MTDIVQFRIGSAAARAVVLEQLRDRAKARGYEPSRVELSSVLGGVRVTCYRATAVLLLEDIGHAIAAATERHVLDECLTAVREIDRELAGETRASDSLLPGSRERPLLGMWAVSPMIVTTGGY